MRTSDSNELKSKPDNRKNAVLSGVIPRYSPNYKRSKHPIIIRLLGLWRILTCRNFILIDFTETKTDGKEGRRVRPLYRSDYDGESEFLTLKAALLMKSENGA